MAFHWRGVPDEDAARTRLEGIAREAEAAGLDIHWGRKVLEIRPPVPVDKGQAVRELVERSGVRAALFGGDDATDLDAFAALDALVAEGVLDAARQGRACARTEGPAAIVERADPSSTGTEGFVAVLEALAGRMRFPRLPAHLRAAVRAVRPRRSPRSRSPGAAAKDDRTLALRRARLVGGRRGRRPVARARRRRSRRASGAAGRRARTQPALPELEPGAILFNRLWALALFTVGSGGGRVPHPAGPGDRGRLRASRRRWPGASSRAAVEAIEGRDGVRFYVEHTSPFKPHAA